MSHQLPDPFIWNNEQWTLVGAEDIYSLFDPEKFGLSPTSPGTNCRKGFVFQLRVVDNELILDWLMVYCENNEYPPINGVTAEPCDFMGMLAYKDINLKQDYSGVILIGQELMPEFMRSAFTGPYSYDRTFELKFENGKFVESKDTSGSYSRF